MLYTGCSAGGYGSLFMGAYALEQYTRFSPDTCVAVVADSSLGVVPGDFSKAHTGTWNFECTLPYWMEAQGLARTDPQNVRRPGTFTDLWEALATKYPHASLGLYTSTRDFSQVGQSLCASVSVCVGFQLCLSRCISALVSLYLSIYVPVSLCSGGVVAWGW